MDKVMIPELVHWVLDQIDERYQQTPWMWPVDNQSFQQNKRNLLLKKQLIYKFKFCL